MTKIQPHLILEDGGKHPCVVPLSLLFRVNHCFDEVLLSDLVQDGVKALVQDVVGTFQSPGCPMRSIFSVQELPLVVFIDLHGAFLDAVSQALMHTLARLATEPIPCKTTVKPQPRVSGLDKPSTNDGQNLIQDQIWNTSCGDGYVEALLPSSFAKGRISQTRLAENDIAKEDTLASGPNIVSEVPGIKNSLGQQAILQSKSKTW